MRAPLVWIAAFAIACASAGCSLIVPSESDFTPDLDTGVTPDAAMPSPGPSGDGGEDAMDAGVPDASS
jgi:hypothetical protein